MAADKDDRIVVAVNIARGYVLDERGTVGDIDGYIDIDGDHTNDVEQARFAIVKWRDDETWSPVAITDLQLQTIH